MVDKIYRTNIEDLLIEVTFANYHLTKLFASTDASEKALKENLQSAMMSLSTVNDRLLDAYLCIIVSNTCNK